MKLTGKIESLLFVASRPLSMKRIADLLGVDQETVKAGVDEIKQWYNTEERGIQVAQHGSSVQLVTNSLNAKIVADFLKEERSGELTRPALETLTIIAYRGPLPKAEIDLIRGVNCSLILRNLMIRGLIESREDRGKMITVYEISFDFLRHLGIREIRELPEYEKLYRDERLEQFLHPAVSAVREEPERPETGSASPAPTSAGHQPQ